MQDEVKEALGSEYTDYNLIIHRNKDYWAI